MKTLFLIVIVLFVIFSVLCLFYAAFYVSSEAEKADKKIWENFKKRMEYENEHDDE